MKKGKELLKAFDYIDDDYLDLVEEMRVKKKVWWKSGAAAAACLCVLTSASAVAFASNMFGVKDLVIGNKSTEAGVSDEATLQETVGQTTAQNVTFNEDGKTGTIVTADGIELEFIIDDDASENSSAAKNQGAADLISLAGTNDSPEAMALKEWNTFCDSYDKDGVIRDRNNLMAPDSWGEDVKYYGVYSDEMADKLREIAAKYNLKLHTKTGTMTFDEFDSYFGGKLLADGTECFGARYFEDGAVSFDADYQDKDGYLIDYQFTRQMKGTFNESFLAVGNAESYEQIPYTTKDGTDVILALSADKALIIFNTENSFTVVNIMADEYSKMVGDENVRGEFSMEKLKSFADTFDFGLLK